MGRFNPFRGFFAKREDDAPASVPLVDWNGNGRIDPSDVGVSLSAFASADAPEDEDESAGEVVALVSCAKQKRGEPCPARELYAPSTLFSLSYEYAKRNADRVYILSAKYGLVEEDRVIAPYDVTLNDRSPAQRMTWAEGVLRQLGQVCDLRRDRFMLLAGRHYYEYLLPALPRATLPLGRLPLGERIEFLRRSLEAPAASPRDTAGDALRLHRLFASLSRHDWKTIDAIPFSDGVYIVFERGETYHGLPRVVRVGTHTSPGRLKERLKDHFVREDRNDSIFRKNVGKALLNRAGDPYLATWALDMSKPGNAKRAYPAKEARVEAEVSAHLRQNVTFAVLPVATREERLRLEEGIIATLNRASDFGPGDGWLGRYSPEREICQSGMWLKQGLEGTPLSPRELLRLTQLGRSSRAERQSGAPRPDLRPGDRVRHDRFGAGTVLSVTPLGRDAVVEVDFDEAGRKKLMLGVAGAHLHVEKQTVFPR